MKNYLKIFKLSNKEKKFMFVLMNINFIKVILIMNENYINYYKYNFIINHH